MGPKYRVRLRGAEVLLSLSRPDTQGLILCKVWFFDVPLFAPVITNAALYSMLSNLLEKDSLFGC